MESNGSWPKGQNADRPRRAHSRSRYPAQSLRTRVRSRGQNALGLSAPQPNKSLDANDMRAFAKMAKLPHAIGANHATRIANPRSVWVSFALPLSLGHSYADSRCTRCAFLNSRRAVKG